MPASTDNLRALANLLQHPEAKALVNEAADDLDSLRLCLDRSELAMREIRKTHEKIQANVEAVLAGIKPSEYPGT